MPKKRSHGDGALYYIKSRKLWRGVVDLEPDPATGKRRQKYVHSRSQTECRKKVDALNAQIKEHGVPLDNTVTIAMWGPRWLDDYKRPFVDPHTLDVYASAMRKWIVPTIGHVKVAMIRPSHVVRVHHAMREVGRRESTIKIVHHVIDMMLEQARKEGLCSKNVAHDVVLQKPKKNKEVGRAALPLVDAAQVLEVSAADDLASLWWFKILCGQRQSEILGATLDSLDLASGYYQVDWSLETVPKEHGCGERKGERWPCGFLRPVACPDQQWRIPQEFEFRVLHNQTCLTRPKSAVGRVVPLIPQLRAMIGEYLARHADEPNPHGLIWRNADGSPISFKDDAQEWRDLLHRAGLIAADETGRGGTKLTGHVARHTAITLLASLGIDFQLIGEIVGHSSAEVTKIYRHADHSEKARAMERLGGLMLPGERPAIEA